MVERANAFFTLMSPRQARTRISSLSRISRSPTDSRRAVTAATRLPVVAVVAPEAWVLAHSWMTVACSSFSIASSMETTLLVATAATHPASAIVGVAAAVASAATVSKQ